MGYAKVITGIYKITNTVNDKVYIGQSINVSKRLTEHKYHLKKNTHYNRALQNSYKCHGIQSFTYELIEECNLDNIDERECYWIEFYDSIDRSKGYNFETGGNTNKTVSQETKDKIRNTLKGTRLGKENPMFGTKLSEERKQQMKITNRGSSKLLNEADIREIKTALHLGIMQSDLVDIFNVDVTTINKIAKAKHWDWVLPQFNDCQSKKIKEIKKEKSIKAKEMYKQGFSKLKIGRSLNLNPYGVDKALKL